MDKITYLSLLAIVLTEIMVTHDGHSAYTRVELDAIWKFYNGDEEPPKPEDEKPSDGSESGQNDEGVEGDEPPKAISESDWNDLVDAGEKLTHQNEALTTERDNLIVERDNLKKAHNNLLEQLETQQTNLNLLNDDHIRLQQKHDDLTKEHEAFLAEATKPKEVVVEQSINTPAENAEASAQASEQIVEAAASKKK